MTKSRSGGDDEYDWAGSYHLAPLYLANSSHGEDVSQYFSKSGTMNSVRKNPRDLILLTSQVTVWVYLSYDSIRLPDCKIHLFQRVSLLPRYSVLCVGRNAESTSHLIHLSPRRHQHQHGQSLNLQQTSEQAGANGDGPVCPMMDQSDNGPVFLMVDQSS
ncbi:uncharacterized protein LOC128208470 [Mya arenaria]|uniref:uncharacterized protein LOC128208470 n=1 Tax=Mya arenaria TaxID=6604 RepID=UPI0022E5AD26|nr:uncharacterized protein LOC128208470 [Mya arenaria]